MKINSLPQQPTISNSLNKEVEKGNDGRLFDSMLDSVKAMNHTQIQSTNQMTQVIKGESDDTHGALIALEKADMQLSLGVTVRDKLIQGYQTLMNMQI